MLGPLGGITAQPPSASATTAAGIAILIDLVLDIMRVHFEMGIQTLSQSAQSMVTG
jgi:hypothetical protein